MALLNDVGPFAKYWGLSVAAWSDPALPPGGGSKVQYIWESIKQDYASRGESLPQNGFLQVNRLLSSSASVNRAMLQLGRDTVAAERSGLDRAITSAHIAQDIDSRDPNAQPAGASYRVRFRADITSGGIAMTQWFTWAPGARLPATVFGLQDAIDVVSRGFAEDYAIDELSPTGDTVITSY